MTKNDFWLYNLLRHQAAGLIATGVDFGVTLILTNVFLIWVGYSNFTGAAAGAVVNFIISTYWAFSGSKNKLINQIWKYSLVSLGSALLNTSLVVLFTEILFQFDLVITKIVIAITIAWTYNFLLMRYFVFRK
ncbi:MAG: GtrA family protein [Vicingaceae bacterium]